MDAAITALIGAIEKGGQTALAVVLAVAWWFERQERKDAQKFIIDKMLPLIAETKRAFEDFGRLLTGDRSK